MILDSQKLTQKHRIGDQTCSLSRASTWTSKLGGPQGRWSTRSPGVWSWRCLTCGSATDRCRPRPPGCLLWQGTEEGILLPWWLEVTWHRPSRTQLQPKVMYFAVVHYKRNQLILFIQTTYYNLLFSLEFTSFQRHSFVAKYSMPFHMVWSVLLGVLAQKTTF